MPTISLYINQASLDTNENVWCVGRDLTKFDGSNWTYYNYLNSFVPDNSPYYLDTRSISIDSSDNKWVGCAVSTSLSQVLIFEAIGENATTGESWEISDFGLTGSPNWECSTIYASPFGNEVLAFITPLNGGGGTGATGNIGVTGGYLWRYEKVAQQWYEVSPGYVWPHIYDISAKGEGGINYNYYLSTNDGLQIIPSGTLYPETLFDGTSFLPQVKKFNSSNSSLGSDVVYSLSFDENGNYWLGTENYLSYWDGTKFYNWDVNGSPVTKVNSRKNGHVFFRIGDPFSSPSITNGLYHFNGDTFTLFDSSNSTLPDDLVIDILVVQRKKQTPSLTSLPNDLWVISGNFAVLFDYTIPHIYATSKFTGTTGWNFVYYTPTTEGGTADEARLPKANKYTWDYPSWRNYQNEYLSLSHPGLDPRNLFLEANFKDIANGLAGQQPYWNNSLVIPYADSVEASKIQDANWVVGITASSQVQITGVTKYKDLNVAFGYTSNPSVNFGPSNNISASNIFTNPNSTLTGGGTADVGFLSFYSQSGEFQGIIPFRGDSTRVLEVKPSWENNSLVVLGTYSGYIEGGEFVWGSEYPTAANLNITGVTGPTGGPIGFSNIATPGITASFDYPWILNGPTGATSGVFIPDTSILTSTVGYFLAEVDFEVGNQTSYGGIDFSTESASSVFSLKNFRTFPGASSSLDPLVGPTGIFPTQTGNSDLVVSKNNIRFSSNLIGGISTLKGDYLNINDSLASPQFVFSLFSGASYQNSGIVFDLDSNLYLNNAFSFGLTGISSSLDTISSVENGQTYLLTGTSNFNINVGNLSLTPPNPDVSSPWYILFDANITPLGGSLFQNSGITGPTGFNEWENTILGFNSSDNYFTTFLYTGDCTYTDSFGASQILQGASGSVNSGLISINPGGSSKISSNFEILPSTYESGFLTKLNDVQGTRGDSYYIAFYYPFPIGLTGSNLVIKRSVSGTFVDQLETVSFPGDSQQDPLKLNVSESLDIFIGGSSSGITGPTSLPYPAGTISFVALLESFKPAVGIDLGNIISRAGSGAWTWVDVHNSKSDIYIPLLSTLFFSNYDSKIFGKQNNRWVLTNSITGELLLDVKNVPYFIFTFVESGYYTIQNSVEDSEGNVYAVSKPAFVKVMNQSIPSENDPNPEFVNSADYGYILPKTDRNSKSFELDRNLLEEQEEIMILNIRPFSSGLVLQNDPNSTFQNL